MICTLPDDELIVDNFAGGGGASSGIEMALSRIVNLAINHDRKAMAMHRANHPGAKHFVKDVWEVDIPKATGGKPVGLCWLSPTCTHFSRAKGAPLAPLSRKIRGLAWLAVKWAVQAQPRVIFLENVGEWKEWGPVLKSTGRPCPDRKGIYFNLWWRQLEKAGYKIECRELRACDYGAPTTRKRLFVIARRDGLPIVWPEPTHGAPDSAEVQRGERLPYRTAAECIDWTNHGRSIFDRKKPLSDATQRRIARGLVKFVLNAKRPFIVSLTHQGGDRTESLDEPMRTITAAHRGEKALVIPYLVHQSNGERPGQAPRIYDPEKPLGTIVAQGQKHALTMAFLSKAYGGKVGPGEDLRLPLPTITTQDHNNLVEVVTGEGGPDRSRQVYSWLMKFYGMGEGQSLGEPLHTIRTKDCFALVTVEGQDYKVVDIRMRMLTPRELFTAQGFSPDYIIDHGVDAAGKTVKLTKTEQIRMVGNSVSPPAAAALVRANVVIENCGTKATHLA